MVVSQERLASGVGAAILRRGGNAIDAAVATAFALAVTLPQAGNLGGGGFLLLWHQGQRKAYALNFREMAPRRAYAEMFLRADGDVDRQKATRSLLSSGVPGTVAGFRYIPLWQLLCNRLCPYWAKILRQNKFFIALSQTSLQLLFINLATSSSNRS